MSVERSDVIDVFSINDAGEVVLTIADHLDWEEKDGHLLVLREKINHYLAFVESGEIYTARPDASGRKVIISVIALYHPNEDGEKFLGAVREVVESAGLGFCFRQKRFNSPPGK